MSGPNRGVGIILVREGRVLLGLRRSRLGHGTWSFPGGKPEPGETDFECAARELSEETGLTGTNPRRAGGTLDEVTHGVIYRTVFVRLDWTIGEPEEREPDKCGDWGWFRWDELPEPLFAPVASLREGDRLDLDADA